MMKILMAAVTAGAITVAALHGAAAAQADPLYDMNVICKYKAQQGREFAIQLVEAYYGVSEATAVRVVGDC
jgi:hypothetical protein